MNLRTKTKATTLISVAALMGAISAIPAQDQPGAEKGKPAPAADAPPAEEPENSKPVPVPTGMHGISGLLSAYLMDKDNERGGIVMKVEKVHRLWRGNKAKDAASGEGKVLRLTGITGKALDRLLLIGKGDRFSIEVKHVRGDHLVYLGEGLKKLSDDELSAGAPGANPRSVMHGFRGICIGTMKKKDVEKGILVVELESIKKTWKQNKAKQASRA